MEVGEAVALVVCYLVVCEMVALGEGGGEVGWMGCSANAQKVEGISKRERAGYRLDAAAEWLPGWWMG